MDHKTQSAVKKFFRGRDASLNLFNLLYTLIRKNCSPKMEVLRTQISFGEDYKYLWVWLPQTWISKRPADSITLTIVTGEKIKNKRIVESVMLKKGFWTHHILIENEIDMDNELEGLIKMSYEFYLQRKKKNKQKKIRAT